MGKIDLILPFRKRFEGVLPIVDNASVNAVVEIQSIRLCVLIKI